LIDGSYSVGGGQRFGGRAVTPGHPTRRNAGDAQAALAAHAAGSRKTFMPHIGRLWEASGWHWWKQFWRRLSGRKG